MREIDNKIKDFYKSKSLTKDHLDKIVNQTEQIDSKKKSKPNFALIAIITILALAVLGIIMVKFQQYNLPQKYAEEVAYNHKKNVDPVIQTGSISELNEQMSRLDFDLHIPDNMIEQYQLLGGKYCSIDKRMAAQLKLRNTSNDQVVTLYVLDKLKNENLDHSFNLESTSIHIWNERSNLFVLASDRLN